MPIQSYRDLSAWQKAMELVVEVYRLTKLFPKEEQFGLTSQLRRAAVSVPANIAEGHGRWNRGDFRRFVCIARGSMTEAETHLEIAVRLEFLKREQTQSAWDLFGDVGRLLNGLLRSLDNPNSNSVTNGRILEETEPYEAYGDSDFLTPDS